MPNDNQAPSGAQDPHRTLKHEVRFLSCDMVTGGMVAAGRALIGWDQVQLAERAGVQRQTLAALEGELRRPQARVRDAVVKALEGEGVRFVDVGGARGPVLKFDGEQ